MMHRVATWSAIAAACAGLTWAQIAAKPAPKDAPKAAAPSKKSINQHNIIQRVLLVSVDGMHSVDFVNCAKGVPGVNGGAPYCPNLAALGATGTTYLNASTSKPSDSFPGLMALVSGGSPRSVGAFYDVEVHRYLKLAPQQQVVYHFAIGYPVPDVRVRG